MLRRMVEGLHAMVYGVYSIGSDDYARKSLGDGGEIHEYVHAMMLLLPPRHLEQIKPAHPKDPKTQEPDGEEEVMERYGASLARPIQPERQEHSMKRTTVLEDFKAPGWQDTRWLSQREDGTMVEDGRGTWPFVWTPVMAARCAQLQREIDALRHDDDEPSVMERYSRSLNEPLRGAQLPSYGKEAPRHTPTLPPLPEPIRSFLCTKCGHSERTEASLTEHPLCRCGYLGFVLCDNKYTADQMREYALAALTEEATK